MPTAKIAISIDPDDLQELDELVTRGVAASRSQLIQEAVQDKLARLRRTRLAAECAKLDREEERAEAESWMGSDQAWPAYLGGTSSGRTSTPFEVTGKRDPGPC